MSVVVVDDSIIHYESFGRGKPIIFVHGWLGSWRYWVPVMEDLAVEYRTYALDLWGFGDSDKGHEQFDVQSYADMLVAFMDELGLGRSSLVGHTLGAAIATHLAAKHPERVSKVLAVALPLKADAINRKLLTAGSNDSLARFFWHRQRPHAEVEMSLPRIAQNAIALTIQSVARLHLLELLDEVSVPLLTVYGDKDNVIDPAQADEFEGNHYTARAIVLPGAHHFPMLDQTTTFARLLRDFMDLEGMQGLHDLTIKEEWRRRTR
ncbi:MAG TPA: alpha/beta hydrolase [Anaerolineae bacterium]|nr:alpha/beta hydrolase [Anaerolineae bacterium]